MKQEPGGGPAPARLSASRPSAVLACRFRAPSIGGAARRSDEGVEKCLYRPPRVRCPVAHR